MFDNLGMKNRQKKEMDCPCGSRRRFASCCDFDRVRDQLPTALVRDNAPLKERNELLLEGIDDLIGKRTRLDEIKDHMSADLVRRIYKLVASVFPYGTELEHVLPPATDGLRSLYIGFTHPLNMPSQVTRYALYTDEIVLVNPLLNPTSMAPRANPILDPAPFRDNTLKSIVALKLLREWIDSGLIRLVPDPCDFDYQLRKKTWALAEKRVNETGITEDDLRSAASEAEEDVQRYIYGMPDDLLYDRLRMLFPGKTAAEIDEILKERARMRDEDPLALPNPETIGAQYSITRGVNLELGSFIAQATGAYPYTDNKLVWSDIMAALKSFPEDAETWSPVTKAFQQFEFRFLNNVNPRFALQLRQDGRLESLRHFMRQLWLDLQSKKPTSDVTRSYCDELTNEYKKAQAEFDQIKIDLTKDIGIGAATGIGLAAGSLMLGTLEVALPTSGFIVKGVFDLLNTKLKSDQFRHRNSMSVFVDLAEKRRPFSGRKR